MTNRQFLEQKFSINHKGQSNKMFEHFLHLVDLYFEMKFEAINDTSYLGLVSYLENTMVLWVNKLNGSLTFDSGVAITLQFMDNSCRRNVTISYTSGIWE